MIRGGRVVSTARPFMTRPQLGNRAVGGSLLKTQMRRIDLTFDETRHGYASFLDFLRTQAGGLIDLHKPAIGDVTVAPKGVLFDKDDGFETNDRSANGVPVASAAPSPTADRYRVWLRDNNFRHVPCAERHEVIRVLYDIFRPRERMEREQAGTEPEAQALDPISLREAKDRLHAWFDENRPAVPWESINSTVYHLFYTWCFYFERGG